MAIFKIIVIQRQNILNAYTDLVKNRYKQDNKLNAYSNLQ